MRTTTMFLAAIMISGCATQQSPAQDPKAQQEVASRVDQICGLPDAEREAELAKLKAEKGLVLYCGRPNEAQPPAGADAKPK